MLLSGARRSGDPERVEAALDDAIELITEGIADLRALITDLRPAALDELGLEAALKTLVEPRRASSPAWRSTSTSTSRSSAATSPARHVGEIESAGYRLVQEALTNVVKHAEATRVEVRVTDGERLRSRSSCATTVAGFDADAADATGSA